MCDYELQGRKLNWLQYKSQAGRCIIGCDLCQRYSAAGFSLHGRQALGRFELDVSKKNNHLLDSLAKHTRKQSGDHSKAIEYFRSMMADVEVEANQPSARVQRSRLLLCPKDENQIALAYLCHRLGLTSGQFKN